MKNPFEKNDHKVLIAGIVIGSIAAGATAYLFLTETGANVRGELAGHFSRLRETFLRGAPEPAAEDHSADYLKTKQKAPKTDREQLLKHEIHGPEGGETQQE